MKMKAVKIKSRFFLGLVESRADLTSAKFLFYHGPTFNDCASFELNDAQKLLTHEKFDGNKKTVLYIHGYLENPEVESIHVIVDAYLQRSDEYNIIILDWGQLADGNYMLDAVVNAKQLGPVLAKILIRMLDNGLDINKFHIVGHSLGGQVSGIVGREIYKRSEKTKKLKRITALDPAFPPFYMGKLTKHISKKDAEFVDIIHTDAWIYGAPFSTGHADFWPNSGKTLQPGCPRRNYKMLTDNDLSSHRRSWWFWAESVSQKYPERFVSMRAKSWSDFKNGRFVKDKDATKEVVEVVMGDGCPTNITGDYYLQTNGQIPFARGEEGIKFVEVSQLTCPTSDKLDTDRKSKSVDQLNNNAQLNSKVEVSVT